MGARRPSSSAAVRLLGVPPIARPPHFDAGSGSTFAYGVLDTGYKYDMNFDQATDLARRAIFAATYRDAYSGGTVRGTLLPVSPPQMARRRAHEHVLSCRRRMRTPWSRPLWFRAARVTVSSPSPQCTTSIKMDGSASRRTIRWCALPVPRARMHAGFWVVASTLCADSVI